jgi:2-oxoglutarate dehydrogenase complex dehydrogenase (E1) component-like enzyme
VALLRLEQIAPFPFDRVAMRISQYPNAELCWVQVSSRIVLATPLARFVLHSVLHMNGTGCKQTLTEVVKPVKLCQTSNFGT